ncbi:MAG: C10 family peptidase [Muribaculaceae bacterium]|nr:C10 family peptidase [Muribaculaceae bacterium]
MKKSLTLLSLSLMATTMAMASPLTPEQALQRLQSYGSTINMPGTRSTQELTLKKTFKAKDGQASLYVFDQGKTGFVVLSADDSTVPVLGYSETSNFDINNLPPALEGWLNQYNEQIEYMRVNGFASDVNTRVSLPSSWTPIGPLLKTTWDQNRPYNNLCPTINGTRTPTGCVATAMAQVMNYFQYPEKGQGSITYEYNAGTSMVPIYQNLSMDFGATTFEWDNMLDNYSGDVQYSTTQANAVATLMKAAGYAVQMNYYPGQSGAVSGYIPGAMVRYFNYDPSAMFVSRSEKTYTEWATLIYNNLKNVGPVIYDGDTAMSGGHSFVCDGYQGNGYFHFNWGWAGTSDGYFLLDALNPPALGTGGAAGGFNFRQDVVVNVMPPKAGTQPTEGKVVLSGSLYGSTSSAYLYLKINGSSYTGFRYYGNSDIVFDLGAEFVEADKANATPEYYTVANAVLKNYPLDPGYVCFCNGSGNYPFPMIQLSKLNIKDNVKYKVSCAYLPKNGEWTVAQSGVGCYNYFYLTKTSSGYEIENFPVMEFDCTQLAPSASLYENIAAQFDLTIKNTSDTELTRGVMLYLLDSNEANANIMYYGADCFTQTLSPGESYSTKWITTLVSNRNTPIKVAEKVYPALYDMDTNMIYYISDTPVTINPYPGNPLYNVSLKINDEDLVKGVYQVKNSQDFQAATTISVTTGIFSQEVNLYVMEDGGNGRYAILLTYPFDMMVINAGESQEFLTDINFTTAMPGQEYYIGIIVGNSNYLACEPATFVALSNEAGIESVIGNNGDMILIQDRKAGRVSVIGGINGIETVEAYYLNGTKAPIRVDYNGDNANVDLSNLGKGIVIVTAVDKAGNRKSTKIAL